MAKKTPVLIDADNLAKLALALNNLPAGTSALVSLEGDERSLTRIQFYKFLLQAVVPKWKHMNHVIRSKPIGGNQFLVYRIKLSDKSRERYRERIMARIHAKQEALRQKKVSS